MIVTTPPTEVGSFSGNGMSSLDRWRLKAPSEPFCQNVQRCIEVSPDRQPAGRADVLPLLECFSTASKIRLRSFPTSCAGW